MEDKVTDNLPVEAEAKALPARRGPGAPKGTRHKITAIKQDVELALREASAERINEVLERAVEMALAGDRTMIKLLLELHMAKGTNDEGRNVGSKTEIHIKGTDAPEHRRVSVIDVEPIEVETNG